ncbi:hypothetical protein QJS10_CPA09g01797 [Acorus calamus]|uniref:Uncharacterized protein n=1 Tax=Acorus calamus TaxID=4465 RepID=A0AAV9E371_ACOCL|nr:hypothetical protein QJS10_CPA09g01797 [Acorus calamus]
MESLLLPTSSKLPFFMMIVSDGMQRESMISFDKGYTNPNVQNAHAPDSRSPFHSNSYVPGGRKSLVSHALPETALSVAVAAVAVGTAASFLVRTIKPPETVEKASKEMELLFEVPCSSIMYHLWREWKARLIM